MTKPIGYYVSDQGDTTTLDEIRATYGDRLEELDESQKITLLASITEVMDINNLGVVPESLLNSLDSLSNHSLLGLVVAIAEQLRHGR